MKKIEQLLKNILLKILLLLSRQRKEAELNFNSNSNILFIRLNRIGDALVTTPLFRIIKNKLDCGIYVLADKKNHFIFRGNPFVDEVIIFDKSIHSFSKINNLVKEKNIDTIIDLHDDVSATVSFLLKFAKVKRVLGLRKFNRKLYTNTVERIDAEKYHVIERILEICRLLKIEYSKSDVRVQYYPSDSSLNFADKYISSINPDNNFLLGINISAGSIARFWGIENYKALLKLLQNYNLKIILFTTQSMHNLASEIIDEKFIYPVNEDFNIFAAGISKLNFLFTPDTSAVHIASANNIPVFGLYVKYNTNDMIWAPFNTPFECVVTEGPTLKNVTLNEVKQKFIPFLERFLNGK